MNNSIYHIRRSFEKYSFLALLPTTKRKAQTSCSLTDRTFTKLTVSNSRLLLLKTACSKPWSIAGLPLFKSAQVSVSFGPKQVGTSPDRCDENQNSKSPFREALKTPKVFYRLYISDSVSSVWHFFIAQHNAWLILLRLIAGQAAGNASETETLTNSTNSAWILLVSFLTHHGRNNWRIPHLNLTHDFKSMSQI